MRSFSLKPSVRILCIVGAMSFPWIVNAAEDVKQTPADQTEVQALTQRTEKLEAKVEKLNKRLFQVKKIESAQHRKILREEQVQHQRLQREERVQHQRLHRQEQVEYKHIQHQIAQTNKEIKLVESSPTTPLGRPIHPQSTKFETTKILELGSMPVVTSPYIGIQERYNGSQLIVNVPPYNDDVRLLVQRYKLSQVLKDRGLPQPTSPIVSLSGQVTAYANYMRAFTGNRSSDINLGAAELDVIGQLHEWVTGLLALNYDNSPPTVGFVTRVANSRIFLSKGFLTIGNFNVAPIYATMGQRFVPFGRYASAMISTPLPADIGSTRARSVGIGYLQTPESGGWYAGIYTFHGDIQVGANNNINRVGGTVGYQYPFGKGNDVDVGIDGINEVAESATMQNNGSTNPFMGFGATSATEMLSKRVPGVDVHSKFILDSFSVFAEYASATTAFSPLDMTFNGVGAKPRAGQLEGVYSFTIYDRPSSFALSFNRTWEALALNDPQRRYSTTVSTSPWKDTVLAVEYRYDINYQTTDSATGAGSIAFSPPGRVGNLLTAQFGVYF